ncbi:phospholipase D-like domain-containing protein (plasmid) [Bradyrhizobium sp. 41S5]|uniref:phospholipase D-like domain-containing protein n=1 Tax=Bradyrhizobium sp. 41S5 TaxID=1404443 RepID=UPI001595E910|nr:phospholipase D-like domain-containing protein [Bradyrhizobium sp. 41S5]UFX49422.1 phospholipase D-like domain-containing protein [Bradyrhizobium sp. 41S5]
MRKQEVDGPLRVSAIAGTRVVLMAIDIAPANRDGLRGFAFQVSSGGQTHWLTGTKYFEILVPNPVQGAKYSTLQHPIQSFLWSDYEAKPDTEYEYTIMAMYGEPGALDPRHKVTIEVTTEKENDGKHGIWFNRGVVASRAYSVDFQNRELTEEMYNQVDDKNRVTEETSQWLSRGLEEACVDYINGVPRGEMLRVVAYEFTYLPLLNALKAAIGRGVDAKIIYHKTSANDGAIDEVDLPRSNLIERTRPQTPHNKFMVWLDKNERPKAVWTGSVNFTPSGFLGQTNVGHVVTDSSRDASAIPNKYFEYWKDLSENPTGIPAREAAIRLTPNPPNVVPEKPVTAFFSPRIADNLLDWYGKRIEDARTSSMFTAAFTVDPILLRSLGKQQDSMRFVLLEKPATADARKAERDSHGRLIMSNGSVLGKVTKTSFKKEKGAGGTKLVPIPNFPLEKWFVDEELARKDGKGFVFFVHTKFLLIDPLSDDPLVCTGSANFSGASLTANDENMLFIRGDTRVADIYMTEFDRIFRHFFFRMTANRAAINHEDEEEAKRKAAILDTGAVWIAPFFQDNNFKCIRRLMFFADRSLTWAPQAARDPDVFDNEEQRAKDKRAAAKLRRDAKKAAEGEGVPKKKKKAAKAVKKQSKKAVKKKTVKKKVAKKKKAVKKKKTAKKKKAAGKKRG